MQTESSSYQTTSPDDATGAVLVVWNPSAGPANETRDWKPAIAEVLGSGVEFVETDCTDGAAERAIQDCPEHALIVAAGGDGTINHVVNAIMRAPQRFRMAVLPFGTSNNLCRSLGAPLDPMAAIHALAQRRFRKIDVVLVTCDEGNAYFVNLASGGNSDRVIDCLSSEEKANWGPWCYLRNALPVLGDLTAYDVQLQVEGEQEIRQSAWNVLIANGGYAASGLCVAPHAKLDDGLIEVVLVEDGTPLDLASLTAEFFLGDYLQDPRVLSWSAKRISFTSDPSMTLVADGERLESKSYSIEVVPAAIEMAC